MAQLGFVGLGRMGAHMASHLLAGGHRLAVYARRPEAAAPLVAAGAVGCASAAEVAERSDVVFTMLTDTAAVEDVVLGRRGIAETARPGTILVDHSTIAPAGTRRIADTLRAQGVLMLDAPVSGGWWAAESASLSIMVGGDEDVFTRCRPLLELMGKTITYIGGTGAGQIAKACNQICIVVTQLGVAEAVLLAERSGIDFGRVHRALMAGLAASRVLDVQGPKMAARRFEGQIESRLHHKDAAIAVEAGRALGLQLSAAALAAESLAALQARGGAALDSAAIIEILEQRQAKG
jgi:2-hydroxy-3-oxopropionate reductase